MSKQTYEVKNPVKLDGKIVKNGTVECDPKTAGPLVKSGSLLPTAGGNDTASSNSGTAGDSGGKGITMEVFQEAVAQLDPENQDHWMKSSGAPDLKALKAAGLTLSASERDELWRTYKDSEVEGYWVRAKEGTVKLEGFDCDFDTDGIGFALDAISDEQLTALQDDDLLIVEHGTFAGLAGQ